MTENNDGIYTRLELLRRRLEELVDVHGTTEALDRLQEIEDNLNYRRDDAIRRYFNS